MQYGLLCLTTCRRRRFTRPGAWHQARTTTSTTGRRLRCRVTSWQLRLPRGHARRQLWQGVNWLSRQPPPHARQRQRERVYRRHHPRLTRPRVRKRQQRRRVDRHHRRRRVRRGYRLHLARRLPRGHRRSPHMGRFYEQRGRHHHPPIPHSPPRTRPLAGVALAIPPRPWVLPGGPRQLPRVPAAGRCRLALVAGVLRLQRYRRRWPHGLPGRRLHPLGCAMVV